MRSPGLGRAANAGRLLGLADVVAAAASQAMRRGDLAAGADLAFLLLVRLPGFNDRPAFRPSGARRGAGRPRSPPPCRGDRPAGHPAAGLRRGPDGNYRKYRAMLIMGIVYPMQFRHLLPTGRCTIFPPPWPTAPGPPRRRGGLPGRIRLGAGATRHGGPRGDRRGAGARLCRGSTSLASSPDGRLQLFEANAGMVINPPGPEPIRDYRRAPIGRALAAVKGLMLTRAAGAPFELAEARRRMVYPGDERPAVPGAV